MDETPKTGFNYLLMIEALAAVAVILVGVVWFAFSLQSRVAALEEAQHRDQANRDARQRDQRIERIEQAIEEQSRTLKQLRR
jgi:cbb3-type cytochrome oxidase subunit 3